MKTPSPSPDPAAIVQRQLDAYNARDIEAFMAAWADDAQLFDHPDVPVADGAAEIRDRHIVRFKEPNLFGKLVNRMAVGDMVVDQEVVTRTFPTGPGRVDVIAIYHVVGGKIARAWYKRGEPILDGNP
jgi:hypothetical protein